MSVATVVLVALATWLLSDGGNDATAPTRSDPAATATAFTETTPVADQVPAITTGSTASRPTASVPRGFDTIARDALPPQALDTLALIEAGGPYPYDADDEVFQNREGLLPDRPRGYYREYTVETPGSDDRGARRIVAGEDGERYYTDDHYDSFRWVTP